MIRSISGEEPQEAFCIWCAHLLKQHTGRGCAYTFCDCKRSRALLEQELTEDPWHNSSGPQPEVVSPEG